MQSLVVLFESLWTNFELPSTGPSTGPFWVAIYWSLYWSILSCHLLVPLLVHLELPSTGIFWVAIYWSIYWSLHWSILSCHLLVPAATQSAARAFWLAAQRQDWNSMMWWWILEHIFGLENYYQNSHLWKGRNWLGRIQSICKWSMGYSGGEL